MSTSPSSRPRCSRHTTIGVERRSKKPSRTRSCRPKRDRAWSPARRAIVGGIAAQTSDNAVVATTGTVGIIGGALTLKSGISKRAEAQIHSEVLQELGVSAEAEISPNTIELENQTVELTGTVDAQYDELKRVLRRIYYEELGLLPPPTPDPAAANGAHEVLPDTVESGS